MLLLHRELHRILYHTVTAPYREILQFCYEHGVQLVKRECGVVDTSFPVTHVFFPCLNLQIVDKLVCG